MRCALPGMSLTNFVTLTLSVHVSEKLEKTFFTLTDTFSQGNYRARRNEMRRQAYWRTTNEKLVSFKKVFFAKYLWILITACDACCQKNITRKIVCWIIEAFGRHYFTSWRHHPLRRAMTSRSSVVTTENFKNYRKRGFLLSCLPNICENNDVLSNCPYAGTDQFSTKRWEYKKKSLKKKNKLYLLLKSYIGMTA